MSTLTDLIHSGFTRRSASVLAAKLDSAGGAGGGGGGGASRQQLTTRAYLDPDSAPKRDSADTGWTTGGYSTIDYWNLAWGGLGDEWFSDAFDWVEPNPGDPGSFHLNKPGWYQVDYYLQLRFDADPTWCLFNDQTRPGTYEMSKVLVPVSPEYQTSGTPATHAVKTVISGAPFPLPDGDETYTYPDLKWGMGVALVAGSQMELRFTRLGDL